MTVPTIDQIQVGIKRRLETIEGLTPHAVEIDKPNFPTAYPRLVDWIYDEVFGGEDGEVSATYHFDVWVLVALNNDLNRAQTALNPYIAVTGSKSIKQAIEGDISLGGVVNSSRVTGGGAYGQAQVGGTPALAASVRLEVFA